MQKITPSDAVRRLADLTRGTRFEGNLYLVGGAVRDALLGAPVIGDFDLVTTEDALELAEFIYAVGASSIPPVTYPRFGTAMIRVEEADIELVTARKESYDATSRKPNVEPASLLEDALRRDFTVNTLLYGIHSDQITDPTSNGFDDLTNGILRTPRPAGETFIDDPLRMLRAVRFRWKLGFTPAEGLWDSITEHRDRLRIVSYERIRDELTKMILHPSAPDALTDLLNVGLLEIFGPEFVPMRGCVQGKWHHLDVWDHTMLVMRNLPVDASLELRLSALFHDVAKPPTRTVDGKGDTRFFSHESVGAEMATEILTRWKFPVRTIERVAKLVRGHMRLGTMDVLSSPAARRIVRDFDQDVDALLDLVAADTSALKPGVRTFDLGPIREKLATISVQTPASQMTSPLSGLQIMELLSIPAGPEVGRIKQMLEDRILDGELQPGDAEEARRWIISQIEVLKPPVDSMAKPDGVEAS